MCFDSFHFTTFLKLYVGNPIVFFLNLGETCAVCERSLQLWSSVRFCLTRAKSKLEIYNKMRTKPFARTFVSTVFILQLSWNGTLVTLYFFWISEKHLPFVRGVYNFGVVFVLCLTRAKPKLEIYNKMLTKPFARTLVSTFVILQLSWNCTLVTL